MMIALSKYETEMKNYLDRAILMAPCTIVVNANPIESLKAPGVLEAEMKKAGIYALFGPNFDKDEICEKSSAEAC